jgi:hypothetical protein
MENSIYSYSVCPHGYLDWHRHLKLAVQEFQEALFAIDDGSDSGSRWNDMSDVSTVMANRAREWRKANASVIARSAGDLAILWAMNV